MGRDWGVFFILRFVLGFFRWEWDMWRVWRGNCRFGKMIKLRGNKEFGNFLFFGYVELIFDVF